MSILRVDAIRDNGSGFNDVVTFANSGGTENGRLCRAFVDFNGQGAVAARASFNVSSITDNGTGDYTVNFANALSDANYSYSHAYSSEVNVQHGIGFFASKNQTSLRVEHFDAANSANRMDKSLVAIAIFS